MDSNYILGPNGELYHWGIKGMKWGVRRYQNKDGSLTPAGKKHYASENEKLKAREKVIKGQEKAAARQAKLDAKKAELDAREAALKNGGKGKTDTKNNGDSDAVKSKSIKDMTDDELRAHTTRMQLEKQYIDAQKNLATAMPQKVSSGKSFLNSLLNDTIAPAAKNAGREWLEKTMKDQLGLNKKDLDPLKKLESEYKKLEWETKLKELKQSGSTKDTNYDNKLKEQQYIRDQKKTAEAQEEYEQYLKDRKKRREQGED